MATDTKTMATYQPAAPGALATNGGFGIEGMEGLTPEDMIVPRYDLIQPTSNKNGNPGQFSLNLDGSVVDVIEAVILRVSRTRVMWSGNPQDKVPECSSADGITGRTFGQCQGCEYNRFPSNDPKSGREDPMKVCRLGYTYLACSPTAPEELFMVSLYGTSASPAKVLNSQFLQKRRSPYQAVVKFASKAVSGDKGKYFVFDPKIVRWMAPDEYAPMAEMCRMMAGVTIKEVEPEEEAGSISQEIADAQADVAQQNARAKSGNGRKTAAEAEADRQAFWDSVAAETEGKKPGKAKPDDIPF